MRFSISELAARLGGEQVGPDVTVTGASIDTRTLVAGQLYVPIVAERDGHDFIPTALERGAPAYLTAREPMGGSAIVVGDTGVALMDLGLVARDAMAGRVIGITGSVGKTTTKDLLHRCLSSAFEVSASERSFNNELGLPLTLLNAPAARLGGPRDGRRGVGHVARLARVARPDVGIVTSVAMAHVEYFGDLEGVARAKGELVRALPPSGVAVLNFDDPRVARMASDSPAPVLGYAMDGDAEVRAEDVMLDAELRPRFRLATPWGAGEVRLALHGVRRFPMPWPPQPRPCGAASRSKARCPRSRRPGPRCAWRCTTTPTAPSWSSIATTPTPRRWGRRCAPLWPSRPNASWPSSG